MTRIDTVSHEFVEYIPSDLNDGVIYISIEYTTVVHRCFCGCGSKVVTPLDPSQWKLTFDGRSISLSPSIGSWDLPCRSHYWIRGNQVEWVRAWPKEGTAPTRHRGQQDAQGQFENGHNPYDVESDDAVQPQRRPKRWEGFKSLASRHHS